MLYIYIYSIYFQPDIYSKQKSNVEHSDIYSKQKSNVEHSMSFKLDSIRIPMQAEMCCFFSSWDVLPICAGNSSGDCQKRFAGLPGR